MNEDRDVKPWRDGRTPSMSRVPVGAIVAGALLVLLAAFIAGLCSGPLLDGVPTIREAEAAPVPRALPENVARFHDASEEVTCWVVHSASVTDSHYAAGVSCLPDQWLASARIETDRP